MSGTQGVLAGAREVLSRPAALIFLDYDGTLTPIAPHPGEAKLSERAGAVLRRLIASPGCRVAVISGRALAEVRSLVDVPGLAFAGNHGLELAWPQGEWTHPEAAAARPWLAELADKLDLSPWPGAWLEDKRLTLTVHFRQAGEGAGEGIAAALAALAAPWAERLEVRGGKMSLEVRPRLAWDKGQALLRLREILCPETEAGLFYAGDDLTDEDAFRVLRTLGSGLSVLVGSPRDTLADLRVEDTAELLEVLEALAAERPWEGRRRGGAGK